ncbi:MAG: hypothetical protein Q9M46_01570, partial [Ghiorsea sp.]|nr:hypothetical protein [Ghiorsea sp.]
AVRLFCSKIADAIIEGTETFHLENAEDGADIIEQMANQAEEAVAETAPVEEAPVEKVQEEVKSEGKA